MKNKKYRKKYRISKLCYVALCFLLLLLHAAPAVDFTGKTIQWIVPFSDKGGSHAWSALYAPYLASFCRETLCLT